MPDIYYQEEARIQERIRRELELELKQKEIALKLIVSKEKDGFHSVRGKGKGRRSSKSPLKPVDTSAVNGKLTEGEEDKHVEDGEAKVGFPPPCMVM